MWLLCSHWPLPLVQPSGKVAATFREKMWQLFECILYCHGRTLNNKINRLYKRCLRLIYNNKHSTFHELLKRDCFGSFHIQNLQFLVMKMYKLAKGISPTIMQEMFKFQNSSTYNLRSQNTFEIPFRNNGYNSTKSISYLGPNVWELVLDNLKLKELTHCPVSKNK